MSPLLSDGRTLRGRPTRPVCARFDVPGFPSVGSERMCGSMRTGSPNKSRLAKLAAALRPALETLEERRLFSFAPAVPYAAGAAPVAVMTGDFNNDTYVDVVTTNAGVDNTAAVMLGNG